MLTQQCLPWLIQKVSECTQLIPERRTRESFFSLNTSGQWSAHHGVATFCRTSTAEAVAADDGLAGTRAPGAPGICADLDSKWWWRCAKPALRVCTAEGASPFLYLAALCSACMCCPPSPAVSSTNTFYDGSDQGRPAPLSQDLGGLPRCHRGPRAPASQNLDPAIRFSRAELDAVDNQGRCVITDHGRLVVFNVYLPAVTRGGREGPEGDRFTHKLRMLQARLDSSLHTAAWCALSKNRCLEKACHHCSHAGGVEASALLVFIRCLVAKEP